MQNGDTMMIFLEESLNVNDERNISKQKTDLHPGDINVVELILLKDMVKEDVTQTRIQTLWINCLVK